MSAAYGGTFTKEGVIPHLKVVTEYGTILAPVKVVCRTDRYLPLLWASGLLVVNRKLLERVA